MGIEWWTLLVTAEGKMSEEAEKSVESNETGDTLEDLKRRNAELLRAYINEKPVEFVKFVCESVLGIPGNGGNPFMTRRENDHSETEQSIFSNSKKYHGSFAQLMLDKIRDDDGDKSDSDSEYISFFEITRNWFHGTFKWLKADDLGDMLDILSIQYAVFERYSGELGSAIDTAAHLVYEGVPLYKKAVDGSMTRLSFDDPLYIYVFKKGEYWDTGKVTSFPEWVNGLYMKRSDLDVHDAYFSGSGDLTDEARALRREALWTALKIDRTTSKIELENELEQMAGHLADAKGQIILLEDQLRRAAESNSASVTGGEAVDALRAEVDDLKTRLQEATDKLFRNENENLKPKERATTLRLIGGLAMAGHGLDIHANRINGIAAVVRDLETKGVNIDEDTLRSYLKEASSVINRAARGN